MKDYVAENERILNEWRNQYVKDNKSSYPNYPNLYEYFSLDGIMFKGEFQGEYKYNEEGRCRFRWIRIPNGNENNLWANEPIRVLFLTKDQNTGGEDPAWDVRSESFRQISEEIAPEKMQLDTKNRFFTNIVYSLYGILNTNTDIYCMDFQDDEALAFVDQKIFARINCKKEVGGSICPDDVFKEAIDKDECFLKRQIMNLDADVFVCCGYSESIELTGSHYINFLNKIGYDFKQVKGERIDEWVFYDEKNNKVAINSWHPSDIRRFDFSGMIYAYHDFLKQYPSFIESHRK